MKRHGNLFARICDINNLRAAAWHAARDKRNRREVRAFFANLEAELEQLRAELVAGTYRTSPYEIFEKVEEKRRIIYKLPFRDRVVQWAIMLVLEPIWTPQFTADTHACIKGRGMHSLLARLRADLRDDPEGTAYCLKLDVRKFYPSIDHDVLKAVVPEAEIMLLTASRAGFMTHCDSKHLLKTLDMKKFSDLVPKNTGNLTGTKYHIDAILGREIHLTGYKLAPSKFNSDQSLTLQYSILEQLTETGPDGQPRAVVDDEGQPVSDWVQHITFTGSQALIRQLEGVEITEPLRAKIIKQPIAGPGNRCFYKIVDPDD